MTRVLICAALILTFTLPLSGQSPDGPGRAPFGSYFDSGVDSVNLFNGNLMLNVPVFSLPGRELDVSLSLFYNSQGWRTAGTGSESYGYYDGGWKFSAPYGSLPEIKFRINACYPLFEEYYLDADFWIEWRDSSGARHVYTPYDGIADVYSSCDFYQALYEFVNSSVGPSGKLTLTDTAGLDGGFARIHINLEEVDVVLKDGSVWSSQLGRFTSRNGNFIETEASPEVFLPTQDTLGRTISRSGTTYTLTDSQGQPRSYTLNYNGCESYHDPIDNVSEDICGLLSSIDLPDGRSYEFTYGHAQGFLTSITLPTGATITFVYAGDNSSQLLGDSYVTSRTINLDGATSYAWNYARSESQSTRTVTVTYPPVNSIAQVVEHDFSIPTGFGTATRWRNSASADPEQIVTTTYQGGLPQQVETQRGSKRQVKTMTWEYVNPRMRITQEDQSDWSPLAPGGLIPLTRTTYSYTGFPQVLEQVELKKWISSAYVTEGKTIFQYDLNSLTSTSNVTHKSTPEFARRNVTKVRRYADATDYVDENFYYDDLGNLVEHQDARGKSTTFSFADNFSTSQSVNTYAFPTLMTNAEDHQTTTVYHYETGLPVTVAVSRGSETLDTTYTYDLFNRPLSITRENSPTNSIVSYCYDDDPAATSTCYDDAGGTLGVMEQTTLASGVIRKVITFVDRLSRPVKVRVYDPDGYVYSDTEYNAVGNVNRVSAPYRTGGTVAWTRTEYDVLGRPTLIENPDEITQITFDYDGNKVTTTDEAENSWRETFNTLGQLTRVEEPDPVSSDYLVTDYTYYAFGALYQVVQGSQTRTFNRNWLGRMTSEVHPETGANEYTYFADGLVETRKDARNKTATYTYDDIGRPLTITYNDDTPDVTYTYDEGEFTGFLTTVDVNGVTNSTFEYDLLGNLTEENVTLDGVNGTFTTAYTYDLGGRLLTVTYPSGRVVTQSYASGSGVSNSRLLSLTDSPTSASLVGAVSANAAGAITARTLGPGVANIAETRTFNSRNQLTHIVASTNSATLLDMGYGYGTSNNIGKIRSRTDAVQPEHSAVYTFDEIGRLTAVSGGDSSWGISWTLDRYGNRTAQTPSGLASGRVGSQSSFYGSPNSANRNAAFTYDEAGNLTDDGPNTYYYDAESRLYQINSGAINYAYDYAGRRIKRTVDGVTTYYFYGLTGLMSEFSTTSGVTAAASTDRLQYRVGEQTGTAVMLLDSAGNPRENNRVFPFGEPWVAFAGSNNTEKFTTYQRDVENGEVGLDYAMARYYLSTSGRFMTPDPGHVGANVGDPQSWNAYAYSFHDPINFTDPMGLCTGCPRIPGVEITVTATETETISAIAPPLGGCGELVINGISMGSTCGGLRNRQMGLLKTLYDNLPKILGDTLLAAADTVALLNPCAKTPETAHLAPADRECREDIKMGVLPHGLFRGGSSLLARLGRDVKLGPRNLIHPLGRNGAPQGLSLNVNPRDMWVQTYGGAFPVNYVPEGLQVLPSGAAGHYVVAPATPMTFERYQELLNQIQLGNFNKIP